MTCSVCRKEFEVGDRVVYSHRETFVFKPASVPDTVNPAKASQAELLESRKEHTRTEMATTYIEYGKAEIPPMALSVRHVTCVTMTGTTKGAHPVTKHSMRYSRNMAKRGAH